MTISNSNKQCRECNVPQDDGTYKEYFGYVVCNNCDKAVRKSTLAKAMLSNSFHPSRHAAVVAFMVELEDRIVSLEFSLKNKSESDGAEIARLTEENGRLQAALAQCQPNWEKLVRVPLRGGA